MTLAAWGGTYFLGDPVATKTAHLDGAYDRLVEHYELSWLVERIQDILNANGVLTVADYRRSLIGARNDGGREPAKLERELVVDP